ncbi:immunoglobulin-like domain-containing receptor 1 isoform X2 [Brachyhypopomus gauderio]|uniref:immunoglobulin-like domain-containing receptor 1 isoform X2 n=1 Tax=Brachyhypopomus gauderio TaxID=698409 RepID=UPI0040437E67
MDKCSLLQVLLCCLSTELFAIQVTVPSTQRSTMLFASVVLRCDYTTSANPQSVLVTWRYKSFCLDPVLQYYTTAYQTALTLGQNPANDCPDRQRTIRTVIQKDGNKEPTLGAEYRERKITIQNKADLVITEVMWWDNGVYFCAIDAAGDTIGDSDQEVELIVYHWLTVLLIIMGGVFLIILLGTCCCPEKDVMQHRMLRNAKDAMAPWLYGRPLYTHNGSGTSSPGHPILYSGSLSEYPSKNSILMGPMATPQHFPPVLFPHSSMPGSVHASEHGKTPMLDLVESKVRGMDVGSSLTSPTSRFTTPPLHAPPTQFSPLPLQPVQPLHALPQSVPFTHGPPSMLSALDEMGVHGVERRVIRLPPIVSRAPSRSSRRAPGEARGGNRISSQSSSGSNRSGWRWRENSRRDPDSPQRGILRGYRERSRAHTRSKRELIAELRRGCTRRDRSYSPGPHHDSWSSEDEAGGHGGSKRLKDRAWTEKPPSYSSIDTHGHGGRHNERYSDKSSRSGNTVVI